MGQAIVYCAGCNAQLRDTDFAKGAAYKIEHKVLCKKCLPAGFVPPPPPSDRLPAPKRHGVTTTSGLKAVHVEIPKSPPTLAWVAGLATGIVAVLIGVVLFSGDPPRPAAAPEPATTKALPLPHALPPAETAARESLARLLKRIGEAPADLDGQQALLDDFARRAPGTSVAPELDRETERMTRRRRDRREAELAELGQQVRSSTQDQAAIVLQAARNRHRDPAWTEAIDRLQAEVAPPKDPPQNPTPAPEPKPPTPTPEPKPKSAPAPAFPAGWEAAMNLASGRDYAAAQTALEKSPDLPLLKSVASLHRDSLQLLLKTPRGQRIALGGVEGSFLREHGGIVELKNDTGVVEIETGEISPAALVSLAKTAGPVDAKTAAAFCLLEGDASAARGLLGSDAAALPEPFWIYADIVATRPTEPSRDMVQAALASLAKPATAADGVLRLQAVLRDHAEDLFVRRNRAAITTRSQGGRDFLFSAEDLRASGLFRPGKSGKLESCWTCEADVEAGKQKDTYLDVDFSTLADTPYRAWVWAGGCCQEVFEFSCQGTELEAGKSAKELAEPGSGAAVLLKPYVSSLKKTHAQHNGPKQPSRWEWVALPLPRYAKPGAQKIRILSDQKGFSVAAVVVSATRSGPPTEGEIKELLRSRGERPKIAAPPQVKVISLYTCTMDGNDRRLVGELRDKSLYGIPMFDLCFAGLEREPGIIIPEQGEVRFTYFLKSPDQITVRLRPARDGTTVICDYIVPSPVVGKPTEVRIPFSEFKPSYVKGPNLTPGELTQMFYLFSKKCDTGFRLDALSLVELRK